METKLSRLKRLMSCGDYRSALRLAAGWPRLGEHKEAIQRGWAALSNPDFYRQIGQDPDRLVEVGLAAIRTRYGLAERENETAAPVEVHAPL
jgi:hypothetical protein